MFETKFSPSKQIWDYMKGDISPLSIVSAIADLIGGFYISYSAREVLRDLDLLTKTNKPTKRARQLVAWYLHSEFHKTTQQLSVVKPTKRLE